MSEMSEHTSDQTRHETSRPLRPLLAGVASLFGAGVGHVYAGRLGFGVLLYGIGMLISTILMAGIAYSGYGRASVIAALVVGIGFRVYCLTDAVRSACRNKHQPRLPYQQWWVCLIVGFIGFIVVMGYARSISTLWVHAYIMPTAGMSDTLMPGDRFVAETRWLVKRTIRHGDVVVFLSDGPGSYIFSQRVIGLPGDVIEFQNEKLIRNGVPIDEPYVRYDQGAAYVLPELRNLGPLTVPDGELFMAGDNRRLSDDSRTRGTTPEKDVLGHVMTIYFSRVPQPPDSHFRVDPRAYGIDDDNPPGKFRWGRIGKRIINGD